MSVLATVVAASALAGCGKGSTGSALRTVRFNGTFAPISMQVLDGQLWLIGSTPQGCGAERVDPSTLHAKLFPLPSCDAYVASGDHHLYVLGIDESAGDATEQVHVVSFDPATGQSAVSPEVVGQTVGSGDAHMAFDFGLGNLWLYTWDHGVLARISGGSGAVQSSVKGLQSGGGHPVMAFTGHDAWFAEGPGGPRIYELAAGTMKAKVVYTAPDQGSVQWVAAVGNQVWAAVDTQSNGNSVHTRLVELAESGKRELTSGQVTVGDSAVAGPDGALWSAGPGPDCNSPQKLWRTDAKGKTRAIETLKWPSQGCLFESGIQAAGSYLFVLDGTGSDSPAGVLYRIKPS